MERVLDLASPIVAPNAISRIPGAPKLRVHTGFMNATATCLPASDVSIARDFTRQLAELLRKEQGALVNFLLALAECDGRRLWASLGYASLFDYLHRELKLSKSSAWYRSAGAALVLKYPAIVDALADGRLCVSVLADVRKVITPENAADVLPRFFHRSAREAKEVAVAIAPVTAPPRQDVITPIRFMARRPAAAVHTSTAQGPTLAKPARTARFAPAASSPPVPAPPPAPVQTSEPPSVRREDLQPLTADLRRLHVTVTRRWVEKLEAAKAALSHSVPSGSAEEVLEAALDALLEREAKRKGLLVKKPREPKKGPPRVPSNGATQKRQAIPAHVRREVLTRDQGRCQARLHDGGTCGSTTRVQLDHVVPVALGGRSTIENLRVLCERHNQLAATAVFGETAVDLFAQRRSTAAPTTSPSSGRR